MGKGGSKVSEYDPAIAEKFRRYSVNAFNRHTMGFEYRKYFPVADTSMPIRSRGGSIANIQEWELTITDDKSSYRPASNEAGNMYWIGNSYASGKILLRKIREGCELGFLTAATPSGSIPLRSMRVPGRRAAAG